MKAGITFPKSAGQRTELTLESFFRWQKEDFIKDNTQMLGPTVDDVTKGTYTRGADAAGALAVGLLLITSDLDLLARVET